MELSEWIVLLVTIIVAIFGLFLVRAGGGVYALGVAVFVLAVIFGLWFIKRHFDRIDAGRH
ncbi:MAG TPA: hypothetical protein VFW75_12830 [Acetobacteraceae bacterium]|nr:hypothetical protein [Acetobacteraceae bacterium]